MFKRRRGALHPDQLREWLIPRKGWDRGVRYLHARLRRLPGTPHSIALGFAFGTLLSFTPFFGLHIFVAVGLAYFSRANLLAAAIGTAVGNPLTFPFIASVSIRVGDALLDLRTTEQVAEELAAQSLLLEFPQLFGELFVPYLAGGLLLGLPTAMVAYAMVRLFTAAYQARRRASKRRRQAKRTAPAAKRHQA